MISFLDCSWLPLPPCLLSLSPFMISLLLLAAAAALSPQLVFLHDFLSGLLLAAAAALSPELVSLPGCSWLPLPPCLPSLSPFMISLLGCSWLPPCGPACFPSCFSVWAALGCRCCLVFQAKPLGTDVKELTSPVGLHGDSVALMMPLLWPRLSAALWLLTILALPWTTTLPAVLTASPVLLLLLAFSSPLTVRTLALIKWAFHGVQRRGYVLSTPQ